MKLPPGVGSGCIIARGLGDPRLAIRPQPIVHIKHSPVALTQLYTVSVLMQSEFNRDTSITMALYNPLKF